MGLHGWLFRLEACIGWKNGWKSLVNGGTRRKLEYGVEMGRDKVWWERECKGEKWGMVPSLVVAHDCKGS